MIVIRIMLFLVLNNPLASLWSEYTTHFYGVSENAACLKPEIIVSRYMKCQYIFILKRKGGLKISLLQMAL